MDANCTLSLVMKIVWFELDTYIKECRVIQHQLVEVFPKGILIVDGSVKVLEKQYKYELTLILF